MHPAALQPFNVTIAPVHQMNLKRHKQTHQEHRELYECADCGKTFTTRFAKNLHVKTAHNKVKDLKCDHCSFATSYKSVLNRHEKTHQVYRVLHECHMCKQTFVSQEGLNRHVKVIHEKIKDLKCDRCSFKTGWPGHLSEHKKKHREQDQELGTKIDSNEIIEEFGEVKVECSPKKSENTKEDIKIKSNNEPLAEAPSNKTPKTTNFKCDDCSFTTRHRANLKRHKQSYHEQRVLHECAECGKAYTTKFALNEHLKNIHEKLKDFKCDLCSFTSGYRSALQVHKKIHKADRTWHECPTCRCSFASQKSMDRHVRVTHDQVKDLKCDKCSFVTGWPGHLSEHKKRHKHGQQVRTRKEARLLENMEQIAQVKVTCSLKKEEGKGISTRPDPDRVKAEEVTPGWLPCPLCPFSTEGVKGLRMHLQMQHE